VQPSAKNGAMALLNLFGGGGSEVLFDWVTSPPIAAEVVKGKKQCWQGNRGPMGRDLPEASMRLNSGPISSQRGKD